MRKLALALAAIAALGVSVPAFVTNSSAAQGARMARADVKVVRTHRHGSVKKVIVKRDRASRHGWRHGNRTVKRTVVVKRPNGAVVRKTIVRTR